ncbi:MAG: hypothetical protein Ct9H300mP11_27610 [Chloroflexota bacterium]|nr:MAG: hypothetical protein Ct9H300mP11_27610 [Chloroflexota bacterium]
MNICLGVVAAMGVDRQHPIEPYVLPSLHKIFGLAEWTKPLRFQVKQTEWSEMVVEHQGVDVGRPKFCPRPKVSGCISFIRVQRYRADI